MRSTQSTYTHSLINFIKPTTRTQFSNSLQTTSKDATHTLQKTYIQRQFKTGVPQGSIQSPTLFNLYTLDKYHWLAPVKLTTFADGISVVVVRLSVHVISIWVSRLEIAEFPDSDSRSAP